MVGNNADGLTASPVRPCAPLLWAGSFRRHWGARSQYCCADCERVDREPGVKPHGRTAHVGLTVRGSFRTSASAWLCVRAVGRAWVTVLLLPYGLGRWGV